jgi:hypothetical protein
MLSKRTEISYENSHPPRRPRQLSQALRGAGAARAGPRPLGLRHATSSWKRPSCLTSPTRGRHAAPPGARARRCCASVNAACVQTRALAATRAAYSAPTRPRAAGRFRAPAPAPSPARPAERLGRARGGCGPLSSLSRTKWTRLVHPAVPTGLVSSLCGPPSRLSRSATSDARLSSHRGTGPGGGARILRGSVTGGAPGRGSRSS